jgi:hypothetical protein
MSRVADNDINSIQNKGSDNNNLIHSKQYNYFTDKRYKATKQVVRLILKSFLDGNIQIAISIKENLSVPIVERFDIYKAESLEEEVLQIFPSLYNIFHKLRLALEKGNRIIETTTTISNRENDPLLPGNGSLAVYYQLEQLKRHIDREIIVLCQNILGNEIVVNEDELQINL